MLVFTAKLTRRRLVAGIMALGFLVCGVTIGFSEVDASESVSGEAVVSSQNERMPKLKTAADRIAFLGEIGWEVQEEPIEFREVMIPEEFDETYQTYNELQLKQGFDLEKYAGKRVMKYSYLVLNHPSGEEGVVATLLVYKGKLIGGDVTSPKVEGFLEGIFQES